MLECISKPFDFMNISGGFGTGNEIAYREDIPELGSASLLTLS